MRGRHVQNGEHFRSVSRTMGYVRARSGSGLSSGVAESVRNDNVSGVSQAAPYQTGNRLRFFSPYSVDLKNGDPAEGIDSEDSAALSHVCIPSMHVSGMVAAFLFRARRCLADPTHIVVPNTYRFATRESRPRARPHTPHSALSTPAVFTILHMLTPHAHSSRTISYLHASRLPFKHTFTFAAAHTPESPHSARSSRGAHLETFSLYYTQTAMFLAPSAAPSHASAPRVRYTCQITSASRTERAIAERLWRPRSAPTGQSWCKSYFGITRVDGGGEPRTRASAGPPLSAARGGSGPITSLPRYQMDATLRQSLAMSGGARSDMRKGEGRQRNRAFTAYAPDPNPTHKEKKGNKNKKNGKQEEEEVSPDDKRRPVTEEQK